MSQYNIYQSMGEQLMLEAFKLKLLKKRGVNKKNKYSIGIYRTLQMYAQYTRESVQYLQLQTCMPVLSYEHSFETSGRRLFFLKNMETSKQILNMNYRLTDGATLLESIYGTFSIAVPRGHMIKTENGDRELGGILVRIRSKIDDDVNNIRDYCKKVYDSDVEFEEGDIGNVNPALDKPIITIMYESKIGDTETSARSMSTMDLSQLLSMANMNYEDDQEAYKDHLSEILKTYDVDMEEGGIALKGEEFISNDIEILSEVYKVVLAVILGRTVVPDVLESGLPNGIVHSGRVKNTSHSIRTIGMSSETRMHYRRGHFRQLMNECYYRKEHKNKPIGSRVIFVKDSMVNTQANVETISS